MENSKDFLGTQPVGKLLFKLAIPTVIAQLINMLYNIVDRIFIGHIPDAGSLALTGVGVTMPIIMIVSAFAGLVSSGGAFMFRSENAEGKDIAEAFSKLGYISFVIHYRLQPYSERKSGIDIARAVKMVRYYTKDYGVEENKIGLIGFSAGGIANGRTVLEFGQDINGNVIDNHYVPDQIDKVSSTANALIMAYSFYGRLSHANLEESTFKDFDLSPTYYVYGTEDPFYNQFNEQVKLLKKLNKNIESQVLNNYPHGFGIQGDWAKDVDQWLDKIYE